MENDKTFELVTKIYAELHDVKQKVSDVNKTVLRIEQEHGKKLEALFDRYKQNTEQLTRIQDEVSRHEEVILKRVK